MGPWYRGPRTGSHRGSLSLGALSLGARSPGALSPRTLDEATREFEQERRYWMRQIAANKRARAKAQHLAVASDKCVYEIPPFDPCFDPLVHNKVSQKWASLKSILLIC